MAIYLSAEWVRAAIDRLGHSRAKRTPLFDFLIVKRTLSLRGAPAAPITESEASFVQALDEIGATGLGVKEHYYFNPFALTETGKTGYRPDRYKSNGTNSTISGAPWQRVIALSSDKPRRASLAPGYELELPKLSLTSDNSKPLPNLTDAAAWYWRGRDVDQEISGATSDADRLERLKDKFVQLVGLTASEVDAVFDRAAPQGIVEGSIFVAEKPEPADYLPTKVLPTTPTKAENLSEVSFDLVAALAAKNFAILTGPSGTGKSRAALKLAEGLQRTYAERASGSLFELVPVGPDWTSPKRLLGYRTPFGNERTLKDGTSSHESYELTDTLRLILRASHSDASDIPHFLIFDEMNLSHVERYFAPFLSLMEAATILEAERGIALVSDADLTLLSAILDVEDATSREAESARSIIADGRDLILPPNLFFVGTVNIDETTYMFSPKVLDRAQVIELQSVRPSTYLLGQAPEPGGTIDIGVADDILRRSIEDRESQKHAVGNPSTILDDLGGLSLSTADLTAMRQSVIETLDGCYDLLEPVGFPFGYRVTKEVFIYVARWLETRAASGDDVAALRSGWPEALDKALLQKGAAENSRE